MTDRLEQITQQALALAPPERDALARVLWKSLENGESSAAPDWDADYLAELRRRLDDVRSGRVECRTHEEVMEAARKAIL